MGTPLCREQLEQMIQMVIEDRHPLPEVMMPLVERTWSAIQEREITDTMLERIVSVLLWWEDEEGHVR